MMPFSSSSSEPQVTAATISDSQAPGLVNGDKLNTYIRAHVLVLYYKITPVHKLWNCT